MSGCVPYNCGTISVKIPLTELLWYNHAVIAFSTTTPGRRGGGSSEPNEPPSPPGSAAVCSSLCWWAIGWIYFIFFYIFIWATKGPRNCLQCYIQIIKSVSYTKLLKIKHEIYKYTNNNTKLLFKNYVKLTLQCRTATVRMLKGT